MKAIKVLSIIKTGTVYEMQIENKDTNVISSIYARTKAALRQHIKENNYEL